MVTILQKDEYMYALERTLKIHKQSKQQHSENQITKMQDSLTSNQIWVVMDVTGEVIMANQDKFVMLLY